MTNRPNPWQQRGGDGRSRRERGAALAEAAVMTPVVVVALVALVVTSVVWRDHLALTDAAAAGARAAGLHPGRAELAETVAAHGIADGTPRVVATVAAALAGVPVTAVERVVVFGGSLEQMAGVNGLSERCRSGPVPAEVNDCTVLGPGALSDPSSVAGCGPGACVWRDTAEIDAVGVFIRMRRPGLVAGVLRGPTMEALSITALEGAAHG